MTDYDIIERTVQYVKTKSSLIPKVGIVLGSGLGAFAESLEDAVQIPYEEIPDFPQSSVVGHAGKLVLGKVHGQTCAVMSGRVHCYEGYSASKVSFGVRLLGLWGAQTIILTNAAGGVNANYNPGELMVISDHVNFIPDNPLRGPNQTELGVRFPDLSSLYTPELRKLATSLAKDVGLTCHEGVYAAMPGPSYETPAEIKMLRILGADAVGMSTVPEAIAVGHMEKQLLAISCITNHAAGVTSLPLSHAEVKEVAEKVREPFVLLIKRIIANLSID